MATFAGGAGMSAIITRKKMQSKDYGQELLRALTVLKEADEMCDFTIVCQNRMFKVHKLLLVAMSDYFRTMLRGPMRESRENRVELLDLSSAAIEHILNFLYTGYMVLDTDNLMDILFAVSHLQVQSALVLCSDYIISFINFSNAEELLGVADMFNMTKVREHHEAMVLDRFEDFASTDLLKKLPSKDLIKFLQDDRLRIRSEVLLFEVVGHWFAHNTLERIGELDKVLQNVRFSLLSEAQLGQMQHHWLVAQHRAVPELIAQGLRYHSEAQLGHPKLTLSARVRCTEPSLTFYHLSHSQRPFEVTAYNHQGKPPQFYQLTTDTIASRDCRIVSWENYAYIPRVVDCGGGTLLSSMLRFDPRHLTLQELAPPLSLRLDPASVVLNHFLYLIGGMSETYIPLAKVECYDIVNNRWHELLPLPLPGHSMAAAVCDNMIFLSGGVYGEDRQPQTVVRKYDSLVMSWTDVAPLHFGRRLHEMLSLRGKLYVLGGIGVRNYHEQTQIPIEVLDIKHNQWTVLSATMTGRSIGHFIAFQGSIMSIGREHLHASEEEIWRYDIDTDTWHNYARIPRKSGFNMVIATLLNLNFNDERIANAVITERR